jgi:hypothetical protein
LFSDAATLACPSARPGERPSHGDGGEDPNATGMRPYGSLPGTPRVHCTQGKVSGSV